MKGQGALEYLMTYGWALLIIVVVGAALYALGILNPATYTQSRCTGFQYFTYQNQKMAEATYTIELLNGNSDITLSNMSVDGTDLGTLTITDSGGATITGTVSPGKKITIVGAGDPTTKSATDAFSSTVTVTYSTGSITDIKDSGTCTGKVQ